MATRVWSTGRKWMGNLIPLGCILPPAAVGVYLMLHAHEVTVAGVALCILGLLAGWVGVNQFGFFGNTQLRREIGRKVLAKANKDASSGVFVGFARPSYVGMLDAHEDLGFLFLDAEALEYLGEIHQVSIPRKDVLRIGYRPNIHSSLGLGRWVSIDAIHKGKQVRLLVEPREKTTLLENRKRGVELKKQLDEWRKPS